mmetsp:Transcript_1790/g.4535  ORF Transcript_1790/g.4535 Transcript_1790/m.4535 type:complete len:247 (-) Transcript_1790:567-1307(-)
MSATYLPSFQDRCSDVPHFLRRHLALIRDLDEKVVALQQEIEVHSQQRPASTSTRSAAGQQGPFDVQSAVTRLLSLADEKVTIAAQVYDFIDKHIQCLDVDLRALGDEIDISKEAQGLNPAETGCGRLGIDLKRTLQGAGRKQGKGGDGGGDGKRKRAKKQEGGDEENPINLAHPPSEHEPLYCFCQRPSHGNMVACDNDECVHEWFHYECVGLTEAPSPDQEWYCPECAKQMKAKRGPSGPAKAR